MSQGIPDKALDMAAAVNAEPRSLSDVETAGFVHAAAKIKKAHGEAIRTIAESTDAATVADATAKVNRLQQEFDTITTALRRSGTEKGRALASQRLTLDQDMSLVAVQARAKVAKGKDLTPTERERFEQMVGEIETRDRRIAELEKAHADALAERAVVRREPGRRMRSDADREKAIVDLGGRAKALLKSGCR